jgi:hypothetical protein
VWDRVAPFSRFKIHTIQKLLQFKKLGIKVWIDHGQSPYNFGSTNYISDDVENAILHKQGDQLKSKAYHTDLTIASDKSFGINLVYAWSHFSPIDVDLNLNFNYFHHNKVIESDHKSPFVTKDLLIPSATIDGKKYHRFLRFYFLEKKSDFDIIQPWSSNINDYINENILNEIVQNGYYSSIATHIGSERKRWNELYLDIRDAFYLISQYQEEKKLLLTRTSRMLDYARVDKYLKWSYFQDNNITKIIIESIEDTHLGAFVPKLDDIRGITFYVQNPWQTEIFINNNSICESHIVRNASDGYSESISIKWYEDYAPYYMNYDTSPYRLETLYVCRGVGTTFDD